MPSSSLWQRFQQYFLYYRDLDFSLDISRMKFPDDFFEKMQPKVEKAFVAMRALVCFDHPQPFAIHLPYGSTVSVRSLPSPPW